MTLRHQVSGIRFLLTLLLVLSATVAQAQVVITPAPFVSAGGVAAGPILAPDGTAAAPSYSFLNDPDTGWWRESANANVWSGGGTGKIRFSMADTGLNLSSDMRLTWGNDSNVQSGTVDLYLLRDAANTLAQRNGTIAQHLRVYKTFTDASNYQRLVISGDPFTGAGVGIIQQQAGTGPSTDPMYIGNVGTGAVNIRSNNTNILSVSSTLVTSTVDLIPAAAAVTVGAGTGITVNSTGAVREVVYKVTVAETAFVCAAVTCDVTIATLPAKTLVTGAVADLTAQFACSATCTSTTLSMVLGRGAGGAQFLASFDADAAVAVFGDADAEMGTTMTRAAAIQAGSPEAWASTQAVVLRLTSGTGNIGDGAANNLSAGSVTLYITTKVLP